MSLSESGQSIAGGWLGAYYYDSRIHLPVRFEATFVRLRTTDSVLEPEIERFAGTIMDDENGNGSAIITHGVQQGTFVRFTKVFTPPAPGLFPMLYVGTLSEDKRKITGHWKISVSANRRTRAREITGTWEARRLWHSDVDDTTIAEGATEEIMESLGE